MRAADIQAFLDKNPFDPFTIVTADGGEVEVLARSLALLHPTGRSMHVVSPKFSGAKLDEDFEDHFLDVRLISNVIKPARRLPARKRNKS
jgi:pimeloyl-ACP methyl ester carboxylesterase